jgi:hypothetical protein
MGHLRLWCGTCSAEDQRNTRFYERPHQVGYGGPGQRMDDATGRFSGSDTTTKTTATAAGWSAARP